MLIFKTIIATRVPKEFISIVENYNEGNFEMFEEGIRRVKENRELSVDFRKSINILNFRTSGDDFESVYRHFIEKINGVSELDDSLGEIDGFKEITPDDIPSQVLFNTEGFYKLGYKNGYKASGLFRV